MRTYFKSGGGTVLTAATAISFVSGILYIWSLVGKALVKEFHWSSTEASLPYTVATLSFAIAMIFAGRFQDSKGPRMSASIGGILLGGGLILSGFSNTPFLMVITFGVIVGLGIGINSASTTPPALKWFPAGKKGFVTGTVVAGIGFASVVYSPLINSLLASYGVSKAFIFLGIGTLVLSVALAQFLNNPPEACHSASEDSKSDEGWNPAQNKNDLNYREMIRTADFYKLWIMLAFSSSAGLMIIGHAATIATNQAHWDNGFLLVIFLAVFNTLGRFLGGTLSDKIGRIQLLRITFFLQALNMILFSHYSSIPTLAIGVGVAGFCYGATFAVFPATTADFYGLKNLGFNYGIVFTAWGLGGVIGPMTAAKIFDTTGNYRLAYMVAFILLLIAAMITFTFKSLRAVNTRNMKNVNFNRVGREDI